MWILLILLVLVAGVAGAGIFALRQAARLPDNAPARFLAEGQRRPGARVVVCLGASITHGRVSENWVDLLGARLGPGLQFVNAGVNGDLAYNARLRLPDVIACEPDMVVVLVGSNDAMASSDPKLEARYRRLKGLPVTPTKAWYRENMEAIVSELKQRTKAKIALCSLPMLGDVPESEANRKVREFNEVLREVAERHQAAYVPVNEELTRLLQQERGAGGRPFDFTNGPMLKAVLQRYLLGMDWDRIAAANGYLFNTDGIHLSRRAGEIVARLVEEAIVRELPAASGGTAP